MAKHDKKKGTKQDEQPYLSYDFMKSSSLAWKCNLRTEGRREELGNIRVTTEQRMSKFSLKGNSVLLEL